MKYQLSIEEIWEVGKRKNEFGQPQQEDCLFPLPENLNEMSRVFIVCDGMGGHDAGEIASNVVCKTLGTLCSQYLIQHQELPDSVLLEFLDSVYSELDKYDTGSSKKMGTTLALLAFHSEGATIAHIGDSRVYHIRPGYSDIETSILFQTEDHSLINDLIKIGELTKEEARHSSKRNVITRAMQPNIDRCKADIIQITDINEGDYFYMCSDGMLEQDEMENGAALKRIFSNEVPNIKEKADILKGATAENSDNHTAFIIEVSSVSGSTELNNVLVEDKGIWSRIKSIFK